MEDNLYPIILLIITAIGIYFRYGNRLWPTKKPNPAPKLSLADLGIPTPKEIKQPKVSRELLNALLYAESEEQFQQLLLEHPELYEFDEVGIPMHQALQMLDISEQATNASPQAEQIVMISEVQPGISMVSTETGDGKRVGNLYEIPADTLSRMMLVTPKDLQLLLCQTLQISLHHPEYLTEESYWLLKEMIASPKTPPNHSQKLTRFQKVLGVCLAYGLNREWILKIRGKRGTE